MSQHSLTAGSRETSLRGQQNLVERDDRRIDVLLKNQRSRTDLRLFVNKQLKKEGFEGGIFFESNPPSAIAEAFSRESPSPFAPHKATASRRSGELLADFINKMFPNASAEKRRLLTSLMGQDQGLLGLTN